MAEDLPTQTFRVTRAEGVFLLLLYATYIVFLATSNRVSAL